jgi:hypothetical protein
MDDVSKNPKYYEIAMSFGAGIVENLKLELDDDGDKKEFQETGLIRKIYPQEYLLFITSRNDFEFMGWWNNWDLTQELGESQEISRPITILRRATVKSL